MSKITTPEQALAEIKALCRKSVTHVTLGNGDFSPLALLCRQVTELCDLDFPALAPQMPMPAPLPVIPASLSATAGLNMLWDAARTPGRRWVPVEWLRDLIAAIRNAAPECDPRLTIERQRQRIEELEAEAPRELTPAEQNADKLVDLALEYVELLRGVTNRSTYHDLHTLSAKLTAAEALLDPLVPQEPVTLQDLAEALRQFVLVNLPEGQRGEAVASARKLLARVPK